MVGEKIITGNWDGQPIWRRKTAGEELADEITKGMETKNETGYRSEAEADQWEDAREREESGSRYDQ